MARLSTWTEPWLKYRSVKLLLTPRIKEPDPDLTKARFELRLELMVRLPAGSVTKTV